VHNRIRLVGAAIPALAIVLAACGSGGGATPGQTINTSTPSPAASEAPSEAPSSSPATTGATILAQEVGTRGTILVAGSNQMTLYIFTKDVKDSGKSVCTGDCLVTWPALTVAAGETPTAGDGITGTLGTITREDNGALQVTYNGLPLYFFKNDAAPGDSNGVYENWEVVKP
jgi:predicted lipoprotein with Yx(FWY)xxD motif